MGKGAPTKAANPQCARRAVPIIGAPKPGWAERSDAHQDAAARLRPAGRAATLWERLQPRRGLAGCPSVAGYADRHRRPRTEMTEALSRSARRGRNPEIALTKTQRHKEKTDH